VGVPGHLGRRERDGLRAADLALDVSGEPRALALVDRHAGLQVGQGEWSFHHPRYVVPRRLNKAVFWLIGKSWPLHSAQPTGAKLKPNILISPTNGSDTVASSTGWQ
jgi:hypothetical protein